MLEILFAIWIIGWVVITFACLQSDDLNLTLLAFFFGWLWPLVAAIVGGLYLYFAYVHKTPS